MFSISALSLANITQKMSNPTEGTVEQRRASVPRDNDPHWHCTVVLFRRTRLFIKKNPHNCQFVHAYCPQGREISSNAYGYYI